MQILRHLAWAGAALLSSAAQAQLVVPTARPQASIADPVRVDATPGLRTLTLPQRVTVNGASGCTSASVLKLSVADAKTRPAEPALVAQALRTGKPLRLANAQCVSDGVMSGTGLSFDPEPSTVDPCKLPVLPGSSVSCAK